MSRNEFVNDIRADEEEYLPSESQLTLLCLDYLRDLRRAYNDPRDLLNAEGLHADWLTLAIYALSRSFSMQGPLQVYSGDRPINYNQVTMPVFNDSWMDSHRVLTEASPMEQEEMMSPIAAPLEDFTNLPSLQEMTKQILLSENPREERDERDEKKISLRGNNRGAFFDSYSWYDYDDAHPSNANRFYLLDGLAGSVNGRGPLLLGEVMAAGLYQLNAKARLVAEDEMVRTPLFKQFVHAVDNKGFFENPEHETPKEDPQQEEERLVLQKAVHDERMGKVVCKFRSKLASRMENSRGVNIISAATYLADYHHGRRMRRVDLAQKQKRNEDRPLSPSRAPTPPLPSISSTDERADLDVAESEYQAEAENLKSRGNAHMQKKEYDEALECYTQALRLCPCGPQSHVYFSNRAAALLSMKMFEEAILDSERALTLAPSYSKAHARLGLAHFLLGDYRRAMEAYTVALKYEPDNKSSKSYLEKAAKKLAAISALEVPNTPTTSSYSVVSEWDKSNAANHMGRGGISRHTNNVNPSDVGNGISHSRKTKQNKKSNKNTTRDFPVSSFEDAEKHKTLGNTQMANRDYQSALESYSTALEISSNGPQSHVYYSNRAAALCYLERYEEAVQDSELSIYLKPNYGKAHTRLGLSKYFLNDLEGSIVAYDTALIYDPDNTASKSYLAKARLKLEKKKLEEGHGALNVADEARRLMADPDMMKMAKKMMRHGKGISDTELLEDPEMKKFARKAMSDPVMIEAIQNIHHMNSKPS